MAFFTVFRGSQFLRKRCHPFGSLSSRKLTKKSKSPLVRCRVMTHRISVQKLTLHRLKSTNTGCTVCWRNNYIPLTTSGRGCWREICRYAIAEFVHVSCPCPYSLVEKKKARTKETPTGSGSVACFIFAFYVRQHIRTGRFWLFLSDTDTPVKTQTPTDSGAQEKSYLATLGHFHKARLQYM